MKPSTAEVSTEEVADKTEENSVAATNDETRNEEGNLKSEVLILKRDIL